MLVVRCDTNAASEMDHSRTWYLIGQVETLARLVLL
jgi:hypothetical protein